MHARYVGRHGEAGVGRKRVDEAFEHRAVAVGRFDEELRLGAAALRLKLPDRLHALVRMHRQVAEKAKALAVESACHEGHEDRRGADPGHDAKALFLSAGDDLSARVSDAGTARLAHDRSVLPARTGASHRSI